MRSLSRVLGQLRLGEQLAHAPRSRCPDLGDKSALRGLYSQQIDPYSLALWPQPRTYGRSGPVRLMFGFRLS